MDTCPHYIRSNNRGQHDEEKLKVLECIRLKTLEVLENIDKKALLGEQESIIDPLYHLSYPIRNKIFNQVFIGIPGSLKERSDLQRIVWVAWMDIVYMVALYLNSDIPKEKFLGILHKNMKYWSNQAYGSLNQTIKSEKENMSLWKWGHIIERLESNCQLHNEHFVGKVWTDRDGHPIIPENLEEVPEDILKEQQKKTACPFWVIRENHSRIEAIWNFIEYDLIPELDKRVPKELWFREDFFTGRIHKQKKS